MRLLSFYLPRAPWVLVYMLQQVEYDSVKFVRWSATMPNLLKITKRQKLELTARAKITLVVSYSTGVIFLLVGLVGAAISNSLLPIVLIVLIPVLLVTTVAAFNSFFAAAIVAPKEQSEIVKARHKLSKHSAVKIAVLGSYGKTSIKELLATILAQGKIIAATPGNKNVLISHARWVNNTLKGDEDVLIFEYGEYMPGDIELLADFSQPEWAIISGVSSAHLDNYKTVQKIAEDFSDIFNYVNEDQVLINQDSPELGKFIKRGIDYGVDGCGDWQTENIHTDLSGLHFVAKNKSNIIKADSGLVGRHMVGPLLACILIAKNLGLTDSKIAEGILQTKPFTHRMQPYQLGGAWIIDDTYNGNLEGMRAGLGFLSELTAKRKTYVTPGLVEQGDQAEQVHLALGEAIVFAEPDIVVLMQNSTTDYIKNGLKDAGFNGELKVETNPLEFYTNLEHFVAAGDVVLLQNDWPDSYN